MKKFEDLMSVKNEIENISASEAKDKLNDPNVQFIDVRDKESFSKGTIRNAIHMDRAFIEFYLAEGSPLENKFERNYFIFSHSAIPPVIFLTLLTPMSFIVLVARVPCPPTPQNTTYSLSWLFLKNSFSRGLPSAK